MKIETPEDLEECYDYYSVRTGKQYKLLLKIYFLSGFNCLKEHYCMNPYFSSGEHEFTIFEIYKMLEALIYIQNKDFWNASLETSLLSHNDFISVFEELSNAFIDRFRPADPDNYYEDYEDEKYCIKKLIDLCNAYLTISKYTEAKTKIVYKSY